MKFSLFPVVAVFFLFVNGCGDAAGDPAAGSSSFNSSMQKVVPEQVTFEQLTTDGVAQVSCAGKTFFIATVQVSADNQDPVVIAFSNGVKLWAKQDYETTPPDSTGLGLASDGTDLYAVFTVDGGTYDTPFFTDYTSGGWIISYGQGGGSKVTVILKLDPADGTPEAGTFVIAKLSNGNSNSLLGTGLQIHSDHLLFTADSWYSPLDVNKERISVSGSSPFDYRLTLKKDLSGAIDAWVE